MAIPFKIIADNNTQHFDLINQYRINLGLHTIELISGLDACEQMQNRKE